MSATRSLDVVDHGVLRFLTAGSVDDGKSTLIGRLLYDTRSILADQLAAIERTSRRRGGPLDLSLLTDGLIAEREQGITIDVAYRYFATAASQVHHRRRAGPRAVHAQHGDGRVDGAARDPAGRCTPRHRRADAPARDARAPGRRSAPRRRGQQDGPGRLARGRVRCDRRGLSARLPRDTASMACAFDPDVGARRRHGRRPRRASRLVRRPHAAAGAGNRGGATAAQASKVSAFRCNTWRAPTA